YGVYAAFPLTGCVPRSNCWYCRGAGKELLVGSSHPTTQQSSHRNYGHNNDRHGSDKRGDGDNYRSSNNNYSGNNNRNSGNGRDQRNRGQQSNRPVSSSPCVPLRATPTRFALRVDADTQESVVELLVPASSMAKLAIRRRIARRTPLRVHLVRLIRSQDSFGMNEYHRSNALTMSLSSATSDEMAGVEEFEFTLATTALARDCQTFDLLSIIFKQSEGILSKKLPPAAEFNES
nr:hypothetical protein [Tanacetum cinerariifolium]